MTAVDVIFQEMPAIGERGGHSFYFDPAFVLPCHYHPTPEFNLVLEGQGTFYVAGQVVPVTRNSLLWYPPGQAHGLLSASAGFRMRALRFDRCFLEAVAHRNLHAGATKSMPQAAGVRRALSDEEVRRIEARCRSLGDFEWPCYTGPLEILAAIYRLLALSFVTAQRGRARRLHPAVARAVALLEADPSFSRQALARAAGVSPGELSRRFPTHVGTSLSEHRNRLRLGRFIDLREHGEHNLMRAAAQAGFGSYSQCHRVFVEHMGCSPRDYWGRTNDRPWLRHCYSLVPEGHQGGP
jgi:AraC-like DNA-binding protein